MIRQAGTKDFVFHGVAWPATLGVPQECREVGMQRDALPLAAEGRFEQQPWLNTLCDTTMPHHTVFQKP